MATLRKGLVSILMPVLNGELFLRQALDTLLAQHYASFEIIILDNQSTDLTQDICREYAARDSRVRYVRDDTNRISHDAGNYLSTFIKGEYAMYACDDDLWEPNFLGSLVGYLEKNPEVGLAFPNGAYVDIEGNKGKRRLLHGGQIYLAKNSKFFNFWHYVRHRRVVPTLFGVYRTDVLTKALPFDTFDETIADVDNLFMLKLMTLAKIACVNKVLFFYRSKFRAFEPKVLKGLKNNPGWFDLWLYQAKHQWNFTKKVFELLGSSSFSTLQRFALRFRTVYSLLFFLFISPVRTAVGRLLVRLKWREGLSIQKDVHHEKRVEAHKEIGFAGLVAVKQSREPESAAKHNVA
jgi:glycosyltransferase involved in cell wall biosynthesis